MKQTLKILAMGSFLLPFIGNISQLFAKDKPQTVLLEVNKSNGGYWAAINLYANVNYTLDNYDAANNIIYARLDCEGNGLSACRVPRQSNGNSSAAASRDALNNEAMAQAINQLLETAEKEMAKGTFNGTKSTKTISPKNGKSQLYFYNAEWKYDKNGNGKMSIRINEDPTGIARKL
ncbi:MAG: hypothetical protein MJZ76_01655 [Bacteroidales bacterium]|nr:hypothetical protein [Bacteroidales bacterium]